MMTNTFKIKYIREFCQVIDCEHKTAPYVEKSDFLVVRTSNVKDGRLIWDDMKFTTQNGYEEWTQRAIPEYGDVLFAREAPAGETCLVPKDIKMCMGQRMVLLRPASEKIDPLFFSLVLASEKIKLDILKLSIGSTVSRINIEDIKQLKVPVPSLDEQRKISKILNAWEQAILTTEKLLANS
ncbi:restriction endonuclease subunit S, partial [Citrobacter freundii]|uniref:restriction endonuclease subunit S n=1 Tax=Citrobacter freundii TaxID=546 RepID=UPI00186B6817